MQDYKAMKNQGNMSSPKDNNSPVTQLKDMELCDLIDSEFKISVLKKFSKQQENSEREFNKTRGKYVNKIRYLLKK